MQDYMAQLAVFYLYSIHNSQDDNVHGPLQDVGRKIRLVAPNFLYLRPVTVSYYGKSGSLPGMEIYCEK